MVPEPPLPIAEAALLNDLIIGHFGNPRDGLVKWYLGAIVVDDMGNRRWAWIERQEGSEEADVHEIARPQMVPFDQRQPAELEVNTNAAQTGNAGQLSGQG
jgi:hypothetical protein